MSRTIETGVFFVLVITTVLGNRACSFDSLYDEDCPNNEACDELTSTCKCKPDYERKDSNCVLKIIHDSNSTIYSNLVDNQGSGSIVAGILVPLFLIVFVMCGIYVTRKYHLVAWLRHRFQDRNENYDEFMIGNELDDDDDEPLQ